MGTTQAAQYTAYHTFAWQLGGYALKAITKPGLPEWDSLSPAESLAADLPAPAPGSQIALYNGRQGALACCLAQKSPAGFVTCLETSWVAMQCTLRTISENNIANAATADPLSYSTQTNMGKTDLAVMLIPKGRSLARHWLVESLALLKPGGRLALAGAKDFGIESVIKDATALFGNGSVLGYKKGERLASFEKTASLPEPPAWTTETGIANGTWLEYAYAQNGCSLSLRGLPGVFSSASLDEGSAFLLQYLPEFARRLPPGSAVLDIGCGNGILGLACAQINPAVSVRLTDADLLAVACAHENILHNHLAQVTAAPGDLLDTANHQSYDLMVTNPPFHAGKETNYAISQAMFEQAHAALKPGGMLLLVANQFLRYEKLLGERFSRVWEIASNNKYRILGAQR